MKKRQLKSLTNWQDYEKELLRDGSFIKATQEVEIEYTLAQSIIELRKRKKLSQSELAKKVGTKQPVISRIETASVKPSIALLERIAQALGAKLEIKFTS